MQNAQMEDQLQRQVYLRKLRIEKIKKIGEATHSVLYRYNKDCLRTFLLMPANVIIFRYFLNLAQ